MLVAAKTKANIETSVETFVETNSGYVVIDPLTTVETASYALQLLFDHVGEKKIVGMIYSHTHSDHFGGVKGMISENDVLHQSKFLECSMPFGGVAQ